jgi:hypothetical protein
VPSPFLVPGGGLDVGVSASVSSLNAALTLGFLSASINNGSISFGGTVHVGLADPDSGNEITLTELINALTSSPGSLVTVPTPTSSFTANLPVSVSAGVKVAGTDLLSATLALTDSDIFSGAAPAFSLTSGATNLRDFSNVTPTEVMGMLGGVFNTFVSLAGSNALKTPIPFTGKTVGDLLDYATAFKTRVLDPLFVSGNALRPDNDGDGAPDFTFGSIQDLVNDLTTSLGLGTPLTAAYDPATKQLSFAISFNRALGFGQANVVEAQHGDASHDEIQTLTVNAISSGGTLADTYRLAFPDANGLLQFTAPIAYNAPATGTNSVQARLEALTGIGVGHLSVTVPDAGSPNVYRIEFTGTKGHQA